MIIKELKELLKHFPDDMEVLIENGITDCHVKKVSVDSYDPQGPQFLVFSPLTEKEVKKLNLDYSQN